MIVDFGIIMFYCLLIFWDIKEFMFVCKNRNEVISVVVDDDCVREQGFEKVGFFVIYNSLFLIY